MTHQFPELKVTLEAGDKQIKYVLSAADISTEKTGDGAHILRLQGRLQSYETPTAPAELPPKGPEEQSHSMYDLYEKWKGCTSCTLAQNRKQVVFGSGNDIAPKMLIIGEAPGPEEERMGVPFIGPTGTLLRNTLKRLNVDPDNDAYITNSVICFPRVSANEDRFRGPKADEMLACRPRLEAQFTHLMSAGSLKGILLVGKRAHIDFFRREGMEAEEFAQEKDFESFKMKDVLGWYRGSLPWQEIKVMSIYHPSYLMRQRMLESSPEFVAWRTDLQAFAAWCMNGNFYNPRVA